MNQHRVLGIDLASSSWKNNGSALLSFTSGNNPEWIQVEYNCISWPNLGITPEAMANTIENFVKQHGIHAVSLDGPQGWRDPISENLKGVGRFCEYEANCQGKTGVYGKSYPQTQCKWMSFCIEVFALLLHSGNAKIVSSQDCTDCKLKQGQFYLLECFPTSTWKINKLKPLPGKSRVAGNRELLNAYWSQLKNGFGIPGSKEWRGTHDDLQAVVASLPAVGLLKGPCRAVAKGISSRMVEATECTPSHWVEGNIWDALFLPGIGEHFSNPESDVLSNKSNTRDYCSKNPFLLDDRDETGDILIERGVKLFRHLCTLANRGVPRGIGYSQMLCHVHGVSSIIDLVNRPWSQSDTPYVLEFAQQVTDASGGRISVSTNGVKIDAGLDTFIWQTKYPHSRSFRAFEVAPYSLEQWLCVFPDGCRMLLTQDECAMIIKD
jgi:hypothetical protein